MEGLATLTTVSVILVILPPDILTEILARLPTKSLLRFKTVSKSWYNLINSPTFINLHINTNNHRHLLVTSHPLSTAVITTNHRNNLHFSQLNHPLNHLSPYGINEIRGCCHGIVCICDSTYNYVVLYNPSTKTHRLLPPLSKKQRHGRRQQLSLGFGYDSLRDDYKVLRIDRYINEELGEHSVVSLYSYKNDGWRNVVDSLPKYHFSFTKPTVLVGDTLHFHAYQQLCVDDGCIVCFDLRTNTFSTLNYPKLSRNVQHFIKLTQLDGRLSVFVNWNLRESELWVMKEYGKDESWVKLFKIPDHEFYHGILAVPVVYWGEERGKRVLLLLLLLFGRKFATYNWDSEEFESVGGVGLPVGVNENSYFPWIVVDSLVSLTEGRANSKDIKVAKRRKRKYYQIDSGSDSPSGHLLSSS